jgi:hypothetical protein
MYVIMVAVAWVAAVSLLDGMAEWIASAESTKTKVP